MGAIARVARYGEWRRRASDGAAASAVAVVSDAPRLAEARAVVADALAEGDPTRLSWDQSARLLEAAGIAVAAGEMARSADDAAAVAARIGYPVALKALGAPLRGRSESGGIALDLYSEADLRESYARLRILVGDDLDDALVQRMAPAGIEAIVAVEDHPAFGRVVSVGLGGMLADQLGGRSRRALPLEPGDADDLVRTSVVGDVLRQRNLDVVALVALVDRLCSFVDALPELSRVRCNPVLVSADGAVVLGAVVTVAGDTGSLLPVRRL